MQICCCFNFFGSTDETDSEKQPLLYEDIEVKRKKQISQIFSLIHSDGYYPTDEAIALCLEFNNVVHNLNFTERALEARLNRITYNDSVSETQFISFIANLFEGKKNRDLFESFISFVDSNVMHICDDLPEDISMGPEAIQTFLLEMENKDSPKFSIKKEVG